VSDGHPGDLHTGDGHPGDLLSAMIDGELTLGEEAEVQGHLVGCASCRRELESATVARLWIRALPAVEPPFGLYERMLQPYRPRHRRVAMAALGAAAAVAAVFISVTPPQQEQVKPQVANLIAAHATSASAGTDLLSSLAPAGVSVPLGK
jgi:predicted anti-sigma-YlaC factor YlaD